MKQILLLLFISISCRAEVPEQLIHDNTQYVDDYAWVFTPAQKQQLNAKIHAFFDTVQISIVTVKTLGGLEPYEFATRLGNKWGIGSKSSNGLLMLVCSAEHKIFLATGGSIQGDMPDIVTGRLIRERALPLFKQGKIFEGVKIWWQDVLRRSHRLPRHYMMRNGLMTRRQCHGTYGY